MEGLEDLLDKLQKAPAVRAVSPADVLDLPDPLGRVLSRMIRCKSLTLAELAQELDIDPAAAERVMQLLVDKGYVAASPLQMDAYAANLARMRARKIPDL